ncbi:glycine-rich cell wall structural protein 1-like [Rosa rugosa]|uniref:glycine-rich cell wall structural protein 1-like n=1 Tax=Rosa rugosa TaxID=74645 RepID=UPI002B40A0FF|nr:glycine-rich cell wall structural protein 1-like [Rosa rugosa]
MADDVRARGHVRRDEDVGPVVGPSRVVVVIEDRFQRRSDFVRGEEVGVLGDELLEVGDGGGDLVEEGFEVSGIGESALGELGVDGGLGDGEAGKEGGGGLEGRGGVGGVGGGEAREGGVKRES